MPKVADVKPMDIKFNSRKEEEAFIKWANDKSTANHPDMVEMRKKIMEVRAIKKRMNEK
ncbi:hypothetical protein GCM10009001_26670 [Virgibacillus siamensis]|uniref:Uncharacterized protein n=1 Tax=Virgibacillus siamensis TaxID=480071 RepID=A0ABN1GBC8_9BACI